MSRDRAAARDMTDDLDLRAQARIGHVLNDKWRLERLLGVGGMAAVYAARHRNGAKAAVKVLHAELGADPDVKQRFLHEGYAANKVEHPNAVQVLDDDQVTSGAPGDAGTAYLVMELLEGESLLEHARNLGKAIPDEEVLTIADQVLDVLDAAHKHGIVHRDLKPENLFLVRSTGESLPAAGLAAMLAPPIRVKVLDFGIARIADGGGKTRVGTALGTPTYMAPEQASGRRDEVDGRTDLFALGATMWRLLTGKRIHDAPSSAEILAKMATVPAPPILSVSPGITPNLAKIIDCSLRFRMSDRYPDAKTMRDDVRAVLEGRPPPHAISSAAASELRTAPAMPAARAASSFSAGGMEATGLPPLAPVAEIPTAIARPPRSDASPAATAAMPATGPTAGELPRTNDHGQGGGPLPPTAGYAPITAPMVAAPPAPRRKTGLLVGLAVLVLAALGGGALLFFASSGKTATTTGTASEGAVKSDEDDDDDDEHANA
ncbi:MAG: serine/threonine-protein kinase, partial [Polyangiales bacterium]